MNPLNSHTITFDSELSHLSAPVSQLLDELRTFKPADHFELIVSGLVKEVFKGMERFAVRTHFKPQNNTAAYNAWEKNFVEKLDSLIEKLQLQLLSPDEQSKVHLDYLPIQKALEEELNIHVSMSFLQPRLRSASSPQANQLIDQWIAPVFQGFEPPSKSVSFENYFKYKIDEKKDFKSRILKLINDQEFPEEFKQKFHLPLSNNHIRRRIEKKVHISLGRETFSKWTKNSQKPKSVPNSQSLMSPKPANQNAVEPNPPISASSQMASSSSQTNKRPLEETEVSTGPQTKRQAVDNSGWVPFRKEPSPPQTEQAKVDNRKWVPFGKRERSPDVSQQPQRKHQAVDNLGWVPFRKEPSPSQTEQAEVNNEEGVSFSKSERSADVSQEPQRKRQAVDNLDWVPFRREPSQTEQAEVNNEESVPFGKRERSADVSQEPQEVEQTSSIVVGHRLEPSNKELLTLLNSALSSNVVDLRPSSANQTEKSTSQLGKKRPLEKAEVTKSRVFKPPAFRRLYPSGRSHLIDLAQENILS